jgi:hypothetical protein
VDQEGNAPQLLLSGLVPGALGFAYYVAGHYEEAIAQLTEAIGRNQKALWIRALRFALIDVE